MMFVVLSHSMAYWRGDWFTVLKNDVVINPYLSNAVNWLSSFHVYTFSLISGFLFYYLIYDCGKYVNCRELIGKKIKRLIVPYVFVLLFWVTPFHIIFYNDAGSVIFHKIFLGENPGQLWFLSMLFWVFIFSYLLKNIYIYHSLFSLALNVILYFFASVGGYFLPNYFGIWDAFRHMIFFFIGFKLSQIGGSKIFSKIPSWILIVVNVSIFILWNILSNTDVIYVSIAEKLIQLLLRIDGSISAYVLLERLFRKVQVKNKLVNNMIVNSMGIYLFHQQIIYCVLFFTVGKLNTYINVGFNFFVSISISLIITNFLNKNYFLKRLLGN